MIIIFSKNYCKVYSSGLTKQSGQNLKHTHTFTGSPVNTDEKGGHSHTTNSQSTSTTGKQSENPTFNGTNVTAQTGHMTHRDLDSKFRQSPFTSFRTTTSEAGTGQTNPMMNGDAAYRLGINYTPEGSLSGDHTHNYSHTHGTDTKGAHTHSVTAAGSNSDSGGTECRPDNLTIRIWKRTA